MRVRPQGSVALSPPICYALDMSKQTPPFDPNEFAEWMLQGIQDVVRYRVKTTLDRERWKEIWKAAVPGRNQLVHLALRQALTGAGFEFEDFKQGEATFHLIRKKWRTPPPGQAVRRMIVIPGFGDTPVSWFPLFALARRELAPVVDELLVLDFPGYSGFLSHHEMVTSMKILLSVVRSVCEANPPSILMGHSLGGWLASKVAQELPRTLEHLLVIAPSGLIPPDERATFGEFIIKNQELSVPELISLVVFDPLRLAPLLSREFGSFYSRGEIRKFVESVEASDFIDPAKPIRANKISAIWGDHDRFVPSHWLRHWVEHYGEYLDAYVLKNTGHIPQLESPYATARAIAHALLEKGGMEGKGWKKVQSRRKTYSPKPGREGAEIRRIALQGS